MRPSPLPFVVSALLLFPSARAGAQSLNGLINDLFTFGTCGQPLCLDVGPEHGMHFIPSVTQGNQTVLGFLTQSIGRSTAELPVSATSSGTTFKIVGGLPVKTSTSGGPIYAERPQTLGRGRFFFGANVSGISYTSLNGDPIGDLRFNFPHQDVGAPGLGDPPLENDMITDQLSLDITVQVASLFATWGPLDFLDIGVAVPFVRTSISGTNTAQFTPFGPVAVHRFGGDSLNPILRVTKTAQGSASGIGDVVGRLKLNVGQGEHLGMALLTEVRLPTGREQDLLGAGSVAVRTLAIVGAQFGTFAPHFNGGYVARTAALQNDAILATLGFDALAAEWATVAFDVISEWQLGANKITLPPPIVYSFPFERIYPSTTIPEKRDNTVNASFGMKCAVRGGAVLMFNGLVPLRRAGLQPDYVWTAGVEYAF
jgi:hypothetical protein